MFDENTPIEKFFDEKGFPFHWDNGKLDFGDSTQRLGMVKIAEAVLGKEIKLFSAYFSDVILPSGEFVRHWDNRHYFGQPGTMTRDNLFPIICAILLNKIVYFRLHHLFFTLLKRFGVLWNRFNIAGEPKPFWQRDVAGPVMWSFLFRSWGRIAYPIVFILDFFLILQALTLVFVSLDKPRETSNDLSFQCAIITAWKVMPTCWVFYAWHIYRKHRKSPFGTGIPFRTIQPIESYFRARPEKNYYPIPIHHVWKDVLEKFESRNRKEKPNVK